MVKKQNFEVTFICETIGEFESLLENNFDMMSKKKIPSLAYKFNKKGRKQYDLSFPEVEDLKSSPIKNNKLGIDLEEKT